MHSCIQCSHHMSYTHVLYHIRRMMKMKCHRAVCPPFALSITPAFTHVCTHPCNTCMCTSYLTYRTMGLASAPPCKKCMITLPRTALFSAGTSWARLSTTPCFKGGMGVCRRCMTCFKGGIDGIWWAYRVPGLCGVCDLLQGRCGWDLGGVQGFCGVYRV